MSRQPEGPPPPPVVQRLRVRYAKRGRLRFTSHRDFARAFERSIHRSGLPIAFSAGFSPHPKISYAGAAPTGVASEAEYLEIGLAEQRDPIVVRTALDAALPVGLDVLDVVEAVPGTPALADRIEASWWRIVFPEVAPDVADAALQTFLAADSVIVDRPTKDGVKPVDARSAIVSAAVLPRESADSDVVCATLDLVVRHASPAVRPDDVVTALRRAAGLSTPVIPVVTRLAQGLLDAELSQDDGPLTDPLS
ncbi:MAG TPA: TIGR03936 family radical SAM-associated protein [Mycobacteriales bacterium]|jgi:radical SAM-linked protein|nr:TIGR03936 family radical SAM-associated protein [Mycobacteriales bacterium]